MNTRRVLIAMFLLSTVAFTTTASGQSDLDGMYAARGINPDGSEYRGAVHILSQGDRVIVSWLSLRAADEAIRLEITSIGVGIRTGETLSVSYIAGNSLGVVVYQIGNDGQLVGRWTTAGDGDVHAETLTKLPKPVPNEPAAADPSDDRSPPRRAPRPSAGTVSL